ncbi:MAG: histidine kinase dimerization/phospho-acceptor domain-containing protein, partial [Marmoricola sp.]
MRTPRTLTARLVVTAVALVAAVSILIGAITTILIHTKLVARLDSSVLSSGRRFGDDDRAGGGGPPPNPNNQGPGTLNAFFTPEGESAGYVLTEQHNGQRALSSKTLKELDAIPTDEHVHGVDLTAVGSYRVTVVTRPDGIKLVSGLPTRDVDQTVNSLIGYEVLLILLGVITAAGLGTLLVRRQLRPLNEVAETAHSVAELPLSSGEIDLSERVPARLTDERTEVGRVGAALNVLLAHVETSLEARHRSEQQVRQFVGDASHELRTPLATIHGYAELSRRTPDDPVALSHA